MLRFDGRVLLSQEQEETTGLGREYALMFGERGASVVVNDLGTSALGEGKGTSMANEVVNQIMSKGGRAIPNYDSVEYGDTLVKTAIDNYGRIGIINVFNRRQQFKLVKLLLNHRRHLHFLSFYASLGPSNDLKFLYENHETFSVLPTYAILPVFKALASLGDVPGVTYDLGKVLHGEQYTELDAKLERFILPEQSLEIC